LEILIFEIAVLAKLFAAAKSASDGILILRPILEESPPTILAGLWAVCSPKCLEFIFSDCILIFFVNHLIQSLLPVPKEPMMVFAVPL